VSTGSKRPPGPLSRAVAAILAEVATDSGLSQKALGEAASISQSQMSKYLRGERSMLLDDLDKVCFVLGLSITDVVTRAAHATRDRH
jgi:transcriptional regulator with XRE-family HTH domain